MNNIYPKWKDMDRPIQQEINNGCGPIWINIDFKRFLNKYLFAWMFHASCGHHDFGYIIGGNERRRLYCDYKLTCAMARDIHQQWTNGLYIESILSGCVAFIFSVCVVLGGWLSFEYGPAKDKLKVIRYVQKFDRHPTLCERLKNFRF